MPRYDTVITKMIYQQSYPQLPLKIKSNDLKGLNIMSTGLSTIGKDELTPKEREELEIMIALPNT